MFSCYGFQSVSQMPRLSRDERIDKCQRDVVRLRRDVDLLRRFLNSRIDKNRLKCHDLRYNLERVLTRLGMDFIENTDSDSTIYETVSRSVDDD